jgi:O-antigen ligase/polysaccharide polymerase Wzy-like membrane protein
VDAHASPRAPARQDRLPLSSASLARVAAAVVPVLLVAAGVFLLALNDGTYQVTARTSVAIAVWWAVAIGVVLRLWPRRRLPAEAWIAAGALALLAAFSALSMAWADSAEGAFAELDRILIYLGVFALVVTITRRGDAPRWSDGLALGITAVGLLALTSELFPGSVGPDAPPTFFPGENRLSYPVNYWNGLAILVGIAFPLLLRAATAERPGWARGLALAPFPALTAVIYLASSRGGAAAALFGVAVFLLLTGRRIASLAATAIAGAGVVGAVLVLVARHELADGPIGSAAASGEGHSAALIFALLGLACAVVYAAWCAVEPRKPLRPKRGTAIGLGLAGLAAFAVLAVAAHPVRKLNDFKQPPSEQKISESDFTKAHLLSANGSGRWQLWASAADEWKAHPVAGGGAGSYQSWWAQHGDMTKFVRDAHSIYLEMLGELGVIGFTLLMSAFGVAFVAAGRRLLRAAGEERTTIAALAGALVAFMVGAGIDWMWELTIVTLIGVVCLGLLVGPATATNGRAVVRAPRMRLPSRAAVIAVCAIAVCLEGILLFSHTRLEQSQTAAASGDTAAALSAANDARALQPWASSPYLQLALLEEHSSDLAAARVRIGEAIDRDRSDWRLWLVSARIETEAGNIPRARLDLRRAKTLNPRSPLFAE